MKIPAPKAESGVVSVVIVNFRGAGDTIECVRQLGEVDWPAANLDVVVVENGSGDFDHPDAMQPAGRVSTVDDLREVLGV